MGWASLAAGLLVALITLFTSYSHVNLFGFLQFKVNQQIGISLLLAAMAALVGEDEVFSVGVVKLASNNRCADQRARERDANEADRDRYRAAAEREQTARRYRIQARCLVAHCRFLLASTPRNRLQLNEALALLIEELRPAAGAAARDGPGRNLA
jgi:biopolymer transport protein ExbB/TolQ